MIEPKELPNEYVSIRQIWLQNINRCSEAISNQAKPDASNEADFQEVGVRTVVHTIETLYYSLVDFGQAIVRTEVDDYREKSYIPELNKIWDKYKQGKTAVSKCWKEQARLSENLFNFIIKTLNKYELLFSERPQGFSNVVMEVVE